MGKELVKKLRVTEVSLAKWPKTKKKFDMLREMLEKTGKGVLDAALANDVKQQMMEREEAGEELTAKDLVVWLLGDFGAALPYGVRETLELYLVGGISMEEKHKEQGSADGEGKMAQKQPGDGKDGDGKDGKEGTTMENDATLKAIQQELAAEREARAAQTEEMRKLRQEIAKKDMAEVVKREFTHIPGKTEDLIEVLLWTQEQDPEKYEKLAGIMRGCSVLTDKSLTLDEIGHSIEREAEDDGGGGSGKSQSKMEKAVELYMEKNPGTPRGTAVRAIAKTNPALYREHVRQERKLHGFTAVG